MTGDPSATTDPRAALIERIARRTSRTRSFGEQGWDFYRDHAESALIELSSLPVEQLRWIGSVDALARLVEFGDEQLAEAFEREDRLRADPERPPRFGTALREYLDEHESIPPERADPEDALILAAFKAECDKVGVPYDPAGLVRHHRGNAAVKADAEAFVRARAASTDTAALDPRVCTDPGCTIKRRPGRPMHGPHDFRAAALDTPKETQP